MIEHGTSQQPICNFIQILMTVVIICYYIILLYVVLGIIQVIGLTASVGVGKAKSMKQAVDHVLTLCANLDCHDISTVTESIDELNKHVNKPVEGPVICDFLLITSNNLRDIARVYLYCSDRFA